MPTFINHIINFKYRQDVAHACARATVLVGLIGSTHGSFWAVITFTMFAPVGCSSIIHKGNNDLQLRSSSPVWCGTSPSCTLPISQGPKYFRSCHSICSLQHQWRPPSSTPSSGKHYLCLWPPYRMCSRRSHVLHNSRDCMRGHLPRRI